MAYEVSTPVFEGPFDLLLHLIVSDRVDLYEVPLAAIVDAYLAELARMQEGGLDLEVATEFLLIAATLVELKARRLLPGRGDLDLDDELVPWEERDLLLARLLECKTFKDAAAVLADLGDEAGRSFPRLAGVDERFADVAPDLLAGVAPLDLRAAYLRATAPVPVPRVDLRHLHLVRASVTDAVNELVEELPRLAGPVTFRRLTAELAEKLEVVVRFLALLELFKQGYVELDQVGAFGDLTVTWVGGPAGAELALVGADAYDG